MDIKENLEPKIKSFLTGKRIQKVTLYNTIPQQFDITDCDRQLVDIGIEMIFDNGEAFSFGWDPKYEMQNIRFDDLTYLNSELDLLEFTTQDDYFWEQVTGNEIDNVNIHWTWIQIEDDQTFDIPDMIEIKLKHGIRFLISALEFEVEEDQLTNFELDQGGWIVISFDPAEIDRHLQNPPDADIAHNWN